MRSGPRLGVILLLYLILAVAYSIVVPIGRGADEWAHFWYAQFIAQHGRLPANPVERETAGYKSDWPPLYHLLAAGVTAWVETDGPPAFKYLQDNPRRLLTPVQEPEAIVHTQEELFPWRQEILVWHLGRFLSIGFSLGTLIVTYFIAREILTSTSLALLAVACLAFLPRFLFTGMLFNYDSLTLLLASLFLWLLIRIVQGKFPGWGFGGLGALAGLALMTKYLTALLPLEILFLPLLMRPGQKLAGLDLVGQPFTRFLVRLGQAALAFLLIAGWWFGYLLLHFNEISLYGPLLGSLAPLLRGDGSDRTVERIFAFLSGGTAPPPAYIEMQLYPAWRIIAEFPITLWGVPSSLPYPLWWFIVIMTAVALAAAVGLVVAWRTLPHRRPWLALLLLHCALPLPFMAIRLFGARDALEAVQGRHLLFLSGPAVAILLVWGVVSLLRSLPNVPPLTLRFTLYALPALLLAGSLQQLLFMSQTYPPPLPVWTSQGVPGPALVPLSSPVRLEGGAELVGFSITRPCDLWCRWQESLPVMSDRPDDDVLEIDLIWQAGSKPALEDYLVELALVDGRGQIQADWLAYQTQARYPTRAWEAGDVIRDRGWLPLAGLAAGNYELRLRLLGEKGEVASWQSLTNYTLSRSLPERTTAGKDASGWVLWRQGRKAGSVPLFRERETLQVTLVRPADDSSSSAGPPPNLVGPDNAFYPPAAAGSTWANFIVDPGWPPGLYRLQADDAPLLRVLENERNFQIPSMTNRLEVNFARRIRLLGYDLPTRRVQPGGGLPVVLYWQGLRWMSEDFVIFNRLLDNPQDGRPRAWGGYDRLAREHYSTLLWAPGEVITDGFAVPVAADAPDGIYTLSLGWYRRANGQAVSLPIIDPETGRTTEVTSVSIGPIKVGGPPSGVTLRQAKPQVSLNVELGEQIELLGFDLSGCDTPATTCSLVNSGLKPEASELNLSLYWQARAAVEADYTVFVHLRNATGRIVAQKDSPPARGAYPTSLWDTGEIIRDEINLPLTSPLAPGHYELVAGLYDFATGVRLAVAGSADGTVLLRSFEVQE